MSTLTETSVQTYAIDPSHSRLGFTVRHMGFSKVQGRFGGFEGVIRMADDDLTTLEAEATIDAASVATDDSKRDAHLRSADFFEVETYPTITFEGTAVRDVSGDTFALEGDFTLHGVTKRVVLDGTFLGQGQDPWGGTRVAFEAALEINRKDYGLAWNTLLEAGGVLVSEAVKITLEIQAVARPEAS